LPKRIRSHELESESSRKFEALLPSRWVFRRKNPDYGIDGEIEIFNDEGIATGLFINVQLKSTDAVDIKDCLKESFQVETLKYYSTLEYPVLIAKYSSKLDNFYFTWAHSKNRKPVEKGQATITVRFPENNVLTMAKFFQLKGDVINYLNYRKQALRPPFHFLLSVEHSDFGKADLLLKIIQYRAQHEVHIDVSEAEDKDAIGKIVITKDDVILSIGGDAASFKFPRPDSNEILLANLNIALAILLSQIGYDTLSAKLAAPVYKISSFFNKPDFLKGLLKALYDAKEFEILFEACKWSINEKGYIDEILIFVALLFHHHNRISREEQILVENLYLLLIQHFTRTEDASRLGSTHYNLGNFYRSKGDHLKALHQYNRARTTWSAYAGRNYFWRELGGVLFDAGKIQCANRAYKKSIEIGEEYDVRAAYADTFIYMGLYSAAKEEFVKYYEEKAAACDPFWCLKLIALDGLIKHFGLKDGNRNRKASDRIILECPIEEHPRKEIIEEAIKLDPTNSFPWFQLGHIYFAEKSLEKSFWAYLWTAVCSDKNLEAWAYAFFLTFSKASKVESTTHILGNIFMAAYERNGYQFISYLFDFISNRLTIDEEMKEGLKTAIIGMIDVLKNDKKFELRLVNDERVLRNFEL
jgi:tetratricopeptide (TPR) repeat protein